MKERLAIESTVLLVDDEELLLETLSDGLELHFSRVLKARDGAEALDIFSKNNIDVVVTDYQMPRMNGIALIHELKARKPLLPVIMLTGNGTSKEVIEALRSGAFDIIDKPCRAEVLVNRIQNSLVFPQLVQILWATMSKEWKAPKMNDFAKLSHNEQLKILHAYSALLKTKALQNNGSSSDGEAA